MFAAAEQWETNECRRSVTEQHCQFFLPGAPFLGKKARKGKEKAPVGNKEVT